MFLQVYRELQKCESTSKKSTDSIYASVQNLNPGKVQKWNNTLNNSKYFYSNTHTIFTWTATNNIQICLVLY